MKEDLEFTPREQHLINFYKDPTLYKSVAAQLQVWAWIVGAIACVLYAWKSGDMIWGLTGFAIVCGRFVFETYSGFAFGDDLAGVIEKYELQIAALEKTGRSEDDDAN